MRYRNAKLAHPLCGGLSVIFQHVRAHRQREREGGIGMEGKGGEREGAGERERSGEREGGTRGYLRKGMLSRKLPLQFQLLFL